MRDGPRKAVLVPVIVLTGVTLPLAVLPYTVIEELLQVEELATKI